MERQFYDEWEGFKPGRWSNTSINLRDFIQKNFTPYDGDDSFLTGPTEATTKLWEQVMELSKKEREAGGVLDMDTKIVSTITSHGPGYLNKDLEKIVGFQTDKPFKRSLQPFGGIRMAMNACEQNGYTVDPEVVKIFTEYRKTHNQGVFDAYTPEMKLARHAAIITGLPDAYGRGRIIGDYRRVALYGIDYLVEDKKDQLATSLVRMTSKNIRLREELSEQIRALGELKKLGEIYGYDISRPAKNAKEAIQWLYFGYLAAVKEQNGAAMSLGRTSTFIDIYIKRDMDRGILTEQEAQELVDHFIMKLRLVKFARTPEYNSLFSGDPTWVTESIGGVSIDGVPMVTKTSFRYLHTLENLGPAPEPNMTVLWSTKLPLNFKKFCAKTSIKTSAIQYENDDLMRVKFGDDYGIACCVSAMRIGKQMQFFGARCNLAKALLYAINGGRDVKCNNEQIGPAIPFLGGGEYIDYDEVMRNFEEITDWLAKLYIDTLNIIHYMHDKYAYESIEMALHDKEVYRTLGCGMSGLSIAADSLAAVKYAKVYPIYNKDAKTLEGHEYEYVEGSDDDLIVGYRTEGEFPVYGNDDDRADDIAKWVVSTVMGQVKRLPVYRGAVPTQSILTITSNVEYGKNTGSFPSGHAKGTPYAPGANPENGMDSHGMLPSMFSVGKIDYNDALDGISLTNTITPDGLGRDEDERIGNLVGILDAGNGHGLYHANINVLRKETMEDAVEHPEKYPHLTVRVSGYAVNFVKLTKEQQLDVISRTFHQGAVVD